MPGPITPTDKLIDERAKRCCYLALNKLEEALTSPTTSLEKLDTYANCVSSSAAAMMDPNDQPVEID